jgi:hypothetical protein
MKLAKNNRALTQAERSTAFSVFLDTLPYDFVRITDGLGAGNRAFTFPGAPLSAGGIASKVFGIFGGGVGTAVADLIVYINFGPMGYANALSDSRTFIHEMTHAWQYLHGLHVAADSLSNQIAYGDEAYDYDKPAGLAWDLYNVEQQAEIVADWYVAANAAGASPASNINHPNFKYIRDNIRANKPR